MAYKCVRSSSQNFTVSDNADHDVAGPISIFCWVKFVSLNAGQGFVAKYETATGNHRSWEFRVSGASNTDIQMIGSSNGAGGGSLFQAQTSNGTLGTTKWHAVSMSYDASNPPDLYQDGVLLNKTENGGPWGSLFNTSQGLEIASNNGSANFLDGSIAEVSLFDVVTNASQAKAFADGYSALEIMYKRPVFYYPLLDNAIDYSGNIHNMTINNSPTVVNHPPMRHRRVRSSMPFVPAAAGGALVKVVNETSEIADAVARASSLTRVVNETLEMAEGVLNPRALVRISNDTEQIAEGILRPLALIRVVTETENLTEAVSRAKGMVKVVDETANITEAVSKVLGLVVVVNETANITEATVQAKAITIVVNETENLTEAILNPRALVRILNETERIDESLLTARAIVRVVNDTAEIADVVNRLKAMVQVVNETEQLSESTLSIRGLIRVVNEIARISESTATKLILVTATKDEITRIAYIFLTEGRDAFIDQMRSRDGSIDQTQDRDAER